MSLATFKRKSVIQYGAKRSALGPDCIWLQQTCCQHPNPAAFGTGFSINGPHRNIGRVGKDMAMSKSGTPYRGQYAIGFGGTFGKYPSATLVGNNTEQITGADSNHGSKQSVVQPVLNSRIVNTRGNQYLYIKPSVLSTKGMLEKRYPWIHNGKYPHYWVQPNFTGNLTDNVSQQVYIDKKASANVGPLNVNDVTKYEGHIVNSGPTLCHTSTAKFTFNDMARNAPYTKTLYQPVSYTQYNLRLTRGCNNPVGQQKPFPFAVQCGSSQSASGSSITSFGSGCRSQQVYLTPPEWYNNL